MNDSGADAEKVMIKPSNTSLIYSHQMNDYMYRPHTIELLPLTDFLCISDVVPLQKTQMAGTVTHRSVRVLLQHCQLKVMANMKVPYKCKV